MPNKLHKIHRIDIDSQRNPLVKTKIEIVACGCVLGADHTESYINYEKRVRKYDKGK